MSNSCIIKGKYILTLIQLLLCLCVLIFSSSAFANVESLATLSSTNTFNELEAWDNLKLADKNKRSNPVLFNQLIKKLQQEYSALTKPQQHLFDLLQGYSLTYNGQHNKAQATLELLLNQDVSNLIKFRATSLLVYVMAAKNDWKNGLAYVEETLHNIKEIESESEFYYQEGLVSIIVFYNQIKQYNLALNYLEKLAQLKLSNKRNCFLKQLTLEARFFLNQLDVNDKKIDEALTTCETANVKIVEYIVRTYKAELFLSNNSPAEALKQLLPHLADAEKTQYPMLIVLINNILAKAYWNLEDLDNAKKYARKALELHNKTTNRLQEAETNYLLYQIAKKQEDIALALEYFEHYTEADKSHLEGDKAKFLAFQLAQHQAFEQETRIKLLNEKNALLVAEKSLEKSKIANIQLFIAILALVLIVLVVTIARLWESRNRIKALAEYDDLTGIYNRRHFTHITKSALTYCENAKQDLSLIMFDLDLFKTINDKYGHACGDWALKEVTKVCQHIGRQNDIFARVGGEEFFIVLPSCGIDEAMVRAEACRVAIEEIVTEKSGHEFTITASFGVTDVKRSGFKLEKLMADADASSFISKRNGRNQISKFAPSET